MAVTILMVTAIDGGDTVHWQTHTVFNQPIPLNNATYTCLMARFAKR